MLGCDITLACFEVKCTEHREVYIKCLIVLRLFVEIIAFLSAVLDPLDALNERLVSDFCGDVLSHLRYFSFKGNCILVCLEVLLVALGIKCFSMELERPRIFICQQICECLHY